MSGENLLVTNIQRFSIEDGPGIRTTVFLAGCNMRCLWCHNPETFVSKMLAFEENRCTKCGRCEAVCNEDVHIINEYGHRIKWEQCKKCLKCIAVCEDKALHLNSCEMSVKEVFTQIEKDKRFYKKSSGGVTFSGGEPLLQAEALKDLLISCKRNGIDTAIETAGNYPFSLLEPLLEYVDLLIIDCKAFSEEIHRRCTGRSNKKILENIQCLSDISKRTWVRIPVIWDVNITPDELERIAAFLEGKKIEKVELLPYHRMGISKYQAYGLEYPLVDKEPSSKEQMDLCFRIMKKHKLSL